MADIANSVVSAGVSSVIDKLFAKLVGTISSICGARGQVKEIEEKLKEIQRALISADAMQARDKNEIRKEWMSNMEDVAFDLENIIVTLNLEEKLRKERNFLKRCIFLPNRWAHLYKISENIQRLQPTLNQINEQREKYLENNVGGGEVGSSSSQPRRWVLPDAEEDYVIGLEDNTKVLIGLLKAEDDAERRVVSVVGMAGLGKTTLAKHVYIHNDIKSHFDCYAWADVSQECNITSVLKEVGRRLGLVKPEEKGEVTGMSEANNEKQLMEKLNKFLKDKRYLVVLDDVWKEEDWDRLRMAFPVNGKKGSKVLRTSRHKNVALHADPHSKLIEPSILEEEDSWKLFCKKAFGKPNCPSEQLEKCGRDMVRECGGLPLAIVVLGGIMSTKSSLREWEMVERNINWHLGQEKRLANIIGLSYDELPYNLKSCFLYFSLFPEDHRIKTRKLFRFWIAEGFICRKGNETLDEAAENDLKELISRGIVQVAEMSSTIEGRVKVCRMHDVLRDFSIEKAKDAKFGGSLFFARSSSSSSSSSSQVEYPSCRVAIHAPEGISYDALEPVITNNQRHRSLLFFGYGVDGLKFCKNFKFLRILDMVSRVRADKIPSEIGKLIHLRYLRLEADATVGQLSLPSSVVNLRMLQTLYLGLVNVKRLDGLSKMVELRYLSFSYWTSTRNLRFDSLINLHTLRRVEAGKWMLSDGNNFTNLVKLEIRARASEVGEVCGFAAQLPSLQSLHLWVVDERGSEKEIRSFKLAPLDKCHKLVKLWIHALGIRIVWLEALPKSNPDNQQFPPHLTTLELYATGLKEDPMPTLEKLPNLFNLRLNNSAYTGQSMVCKARGFPRLQYLLLRRLEGMKEWRIEEGAMPDLRRLHLINCWRLQLVPEGLSFLTKLQELTLSFMPSPFVNRIQDKSGDDWHKVKHIPSLIIQKAAKPY